MALGPFGEIVSGGQVISFSPSFQSLQLTGAKLAQDALVKRWQGTDDVGTLLDHDHWVTSLASLNSDQCSSLLSTGHLTDLHANVCMDPFKLPRIFPWDFTCISTRESLSQAAKTHSSAFSLLTDRNYRL